MTAEAPGLDPARVEAAAAWFGGSDEGLASLAGEIAARFLAADDARARKAGLVATGDAVPADAVRTLVRSVREWLTMGDEHLPYCPVWTGDNACDCNYEPRKAACAAALAALPSSLLDETPEADR